MLFAKSFVIEGRDRCGKKTQTTLLTKKLRKAGFDVALVEVPHNDFFLYNLIYSLLETGVAKKFPTIFQVIQFFNKFFFQIFVLPYLLLTKDFVIFDRWSLSSIVYGEASGVNAFFNGILCSLLYKPNGTVVFTGTSHVQCTEDAYERDVDFQDTVGELYRIKASQLDNCHVIDANRSIEHVSNDVVEYFRLFCVQKRKK